MTALLVSVRNAAEAEAAIAGGAAIIDVKEPNYGPLGRADEAIIDQVVKVVARRRLVTAAIGELIDFDVEIPFAYGVSLFKVGLSGRAPGFDWDEAMLFVREILERKYAAELAPVAYADWELNDSPRPYDVLERAIELRMPAFVIDTWQKDGATLLDWMDPDELAVLCCRGREAAVTVALAGALQREQIIELLPAGPEIIAV